MQDSSALAKVVTPDDIATAALYLINSPSVTGEILRLDAGVHLGKAQ
jgi:enoyl-[acyl-carrier-protein] reductase (NADH)